MGNLESLLRPRSVAVIGASRRRDSIGGAILRNLIEQGFQGPVYPGNPNASFVQSIAAYPGITSVPGEVDLAVIVIPAEQVVEAARACGEKGVKALIVISAGFKETGDEGLKLERALVEVARRYGMRLVGPNCLGVVNTDAGVSMNATFAPVSPPPGRVAFSSQSGALGLAILDYARRLDLGISQFVSVGNKADVSGNDLIEFWDQDPGTDLILLYLESFGNPQKFTQLARRVARTKPIIAVKSGRTPGGSRAASSHTGARAILAGASASKKPILSCFMGSHGVPESLRSLQEGHIPSYAFPESAARTLARAVGYGVWRSKGAGKVPAIPGIETERGREIIARVLSTGKPGPRWMDAESMNELFAAYGVPTNRSRPAVNRGEAASMAKSIGFPVVVKVRSPDVVHKTEVDGV